jgi:hypothetical protein
MGTATVSPLRQRMIEDMNAGKLCAGTQRGHIQSCKRFAAFLKRSPDTATVEDIRRYQLHLSETGANRPRVPSARDARQSPIRAHPGRKQPDFANCIETATTLAANGTDEPRRSAPLEPGENRLVDRLGAAPLRESVARNVLVDGAAELFLARATLCRLGWTLRLRLPPGSHPIERYR